MRCRMFATSAAAVFRAAWQEYDRHRPRYTRISEAVTNPASGQQMAAAWALHRDVLLEAWLALMKAALSKATWISLRILMERRGDRKHMWLIPGGYFYTRRMNIRKRRMDKLRPKETVTLQDRIDVAEELYADALAAEGDGFEDMLQMGILLLSGAITGGGKVTRAARKAILRKYPIPIVLKWRKRRWDRSFGQRSRDMLKTGLLSRPDERMLR